MSRHLRHLHHLFKHVGHLFDSQRKAALNPCLSQLFRCILLFASKLRNKRKVVFSEREDGPFKLLEERELDWTQDRRSVRSKYLEDGNS